MSSVWVKVYIGENDERPGVLEIEPAPKNIYRLKEKIKEKAELKCPAYRLDVYPPQEKGDNSLPWANNVASLEADDSVSDKITGKCRFIVLAPEPETEQVSESVS